VYCDAGALTEEWSLPMSLLALYAVTKHLTYYGAAETLPSRTWFLMGLLCATHFLIRCNNAAPVLGLIGSLSLLILLRKKFKYLLDSLLICCFGFLIPISVCILSLALAGALKDCYQSYILFNFFYVSHGVDQIEPDHYGVLAYRLFSSLFLFISGAWLLWKNALKIDVFVCFVGVATLSLMALAPIGFLYHYYMTYIPAVACTLVLLPSLYSTPPKSVGLILLLLTLASLYEFLVNGQSKIRRFAILTQSFLCSNSPGVPCSDFLRLIPKQDRSSFLGYRVWPMVYLHTDIMPCHKYCFIQTSLSQKNPAIEQELEEYFKSEKAPKWVAIPYKGEVSEDLEAIENAVIREVLSERYERVSHAGQNPEWDWDQVSLYHRIK